MKNTIACKDILECPACGASGARHLFTIREHEYDNTTDADFPRFGVRGCPAVKESVSINQAGDVYPCVFIHTRLGNLREESLHTILKRASQFRLFREHHPRCLSGEDQEFYDNFLSKTFGKPKPFDGIELYGLKNDQDDTGRA